MGAAKIALRALEDLQLGKGGDRCHKRSGCKGEVGEFHCLTE